MSIDAVSSPEQVRIRYVRCFDYYELLQTIPAESIPPEDLLGMQAELRRHGLPLPSDPDADTVIQDAYEVYQCWQSGKYLTWEREYTQNCPFC